MNAPTILSTIPSTATSADPAPSAEQTTKGNEPAAATQETAEPVEQPASPPVATAPAEPDKPDPDLEIAKKLDTVSRQAAKNRRVEQELQSMRSKLEAQEAELAKKMADLEAALEDPVEYYLKKGKDPVEVAKRFARPMTEEEKRIAKLEEAHRQREEADKKAAAERESQAKAAEHHRFWQQFVGETTPDEYPYLTSMHEPHEVPKLALSLLNRPVDPNDSESPTLRQYFRERYDRDPTPTEIRQALEAEAETRATSLLNRFKPRTESQVTPSTPLATEESSSLSNQHASSSPSARAGNESRAERVRRLKEELEAETATSE